MSVQRLCAVLTLMSGAASAAEWTVTPQVGMSADYQDNPQLVLKNAHVVGVASVDARAVLAATDESAQFLATPYVHSARYPDFSELDNNSQALALSYRYEGEQNTWTIAGDTARDSTLTTEFEDTGFLQTHKWRNSSNVSPAWSHEWSDGISGQVSAGYSDVAYEKADATLLADYSYKNVEVSLNWDSGERMQWGASLTAARLDTPVYHNISDDYGAQLSFAYVWSDTQHFNISGGTRYNELHLTPGTLSIHEKSRGWTLDAAYGAESELNTWRVQVSRSVDPSGVGVLVQKDKLVFALGRAFMERVNGSVNLAALQLEELQREKISARRQYATVGVQLNWAWAPTWTLSGAYGYTQQHYQGVAGTPQANNVQFTLTWQGEPENFGVTNRNLRSNDDGLEY